MRYFLFISLLILGTFLIVPKATAQDIPVNPKSWFPLTVGNYWHFRPEAGIPYDLVLKSEKDTIVTGQRWVSIREVVCRTSPDCSLNRWYRLTDDNYILFTTSNPNFAVPDTLVPTRERSVLPSTLPSSLESPVYLDTLLDTQSDFRVFAIASKDQRGSESDSTDIRLDASHEGSFLNSRTFIYRIGMVDDNLIGAYVDSLRFGDTSFIENIIKVGIEAPSNTVQNVVNVFPNPSDGILFARVEISYSGTYQVKIYNLLGQEVYGTERVFRDGEDQIIDLSEIAPRFTKGVYFLELRSASGRAITSFHLN